MSKNLLSYSAFADWCERQGDREFHYVDSGGCACAQYAATLGLYSRWREIWQNGRLPTDGFWIKADRIASEVHGEVNGSCRNSAMRTTPFKLLAQALREAAAEEVD